VREAAGQCGIDARLLHTRVVHPRRTLTAMTDELPGVPLDDDALSALLDRPFTELTRDELMAIKATFEARGVRFYDSVPWEVVAPLAYVACIYSKTFLETIAKHNAEALIDVVHTRIRKNGKTREAAVGPEDGSAARVVITTETPDEARLALLDLDVTSDELRGKLLRWNEEAMAWRPDSGDG
jgi:hypothetical protein